MEIEFKGGNCVAISHKKDLFVSDPNLSVLGLKDQGAKATAHFVTQRQFRAPADDDTIVIDSPGEYEVRNCSVKGIAAAAHMDGPDGPKKATIYRLELDELIVAILGHVHSNLTEEQLEQIGIVDVLIVPVGNHGYTLDAKGAVETVRAIEPKIVIPTHYADSEVKYEVEQAPLEEFIKELGVAHETTAKLKLKANQLPEVLTVYELTRTK